MKLKEIAAVSSAGMVKHEELQVGTFNREAILLTGSNLSEMGCLTLIAEGEEANLKRVFVEEALFQEKRLKAGDILFMSRGASLRAGIVSQQDEELNILPSPNFLIIKADDSLIEPELIVAYLNSPIGQQRLEMLTTGGALKNVPVGKLKDLQLTVPSKDQQKKIKALFYKNIEALNAITEVYQQQDRTFKAVIHNYMEEQ